MRFRVSTEEMETLETQKIDLPPEDFIDLDPAPLCKKNEVRHYRKKDIPSMVSQEWMLEYLKIVDRSLMIYRKLAYEHVPEYKESCLARNPDYLAKRIKNMQRIEEGYRVKAALPDRPPFPRDEAIVLIAICKLFGDYKNKKLVIGHIADHPRFWEEEIE